MDNNVVERIKEANSAYRCGIPIMEDWEYDALLEELKLTMDEAEYEAFVSTLNEGTNEKNADGKVKHPFIMGSMEKVKAEDADSVKKWIKENIKTAMSVSAKVDGISSRAAYKNGKLVGLYSRGDGYYGVDFTDKAKYVKGLPQILDSDFSGDVRGELVILKSDFEGIKDKYANPRNACAGICNRKEIVESEACLISFVPYTIFGTEYGKLEQFGKLNELGFNVAANFVIGKESICDDINDILFNYTTEWSNELPYEIDGLIVADVGWKNEEKYRPDGAKAYKINQGIGVTKVIGFDWGTPSANGRMVPVALLEPISLCGTIVKRVTCNNVSYLERLGIEVGKTIRIFKSRDVIPKVLSVVD